MRITQVRNVEETRAEAIKLTAIYDLIPAYSHADILAALGTPERAIQEETRVDNRELVRIELSVIRGELNPEAFFMERSDDQYRYHVALQARAWREGRTDLAPSEGWAHLVPN